MNALFDELCQHVRETSYLESTAALLEWDQQTKLPQNANSFRSEQITFLAGEIHQRRTSNRVGDLLGQLEAWADTDDCTPDQTATIKELKKDFDKQVKLPGRLVEELAKAASTGQAVWVEARKKDDFSIFAEPLKKIFDLKKEQAEALGYEDCRYDALLDEFEPGGKTREVTEVLENLRQDLVPLVSAIQQSSVDPNVDILKRNFPVEAQEEFARQASAKIGFDYQRGRLDVTHHPFCTETGPNDCRITTRYDPNFFNSAFFGTLHEAGHGIYEQGLRGDQYGLPPGKYCSLGIHESQSRLWENLVGRSFSFWEYFYPQAQEVFPDALANVELDEFYQAINAVSPSLIRVEADEATYNLHIIIRFELEQAVIHDELPTDDLPTAWNEKYQKYLGIQPPSDADGVLQDVHWSAGLVGYFPTYSLGNLYASQFFVAAENQLGSLSPQFRTGEFEPLKTWLNEKIHTRGKCLTGPELGLEVTGELLSHRTLIQQLHDKLKPIYQL
ncbi:MAG: carboxypeptidase M32 [Planctomycetota bacterium]